MIELPEKTYFKIGEVAKLLEVEPYVLRYWETEFDVLEPEKTKSGQRVYQRDDIELLLQIRALLYEEMLTIAGARRQLERSREGKSSYFDLNQGATGAGTAVATDEELLAELEAARRELVEVHQELESAHQELNRAHRGGGDHGLVAELQREIGELQEELTRREERSRLEAQKRAEIFDALETNVQVVAAVADGRW